MESIKLPDSSITTEEMHKFGYTYSEMLPVSKEKALDLYDYCILYLLYEDDTESMVMCKKDIVNHCGMYGVEKNDWKIYLDCCKSRKENES